MSVYHGQKLRKSATETMEVIFKDDRHEGAVAKINASDYDAELHELPGDDGVDAALSEQLTPEQVKELAITIFPTLVQPDDFRQNGQPLVASMNDRAGEIHEFAAAEVEALWEEYKAQE